jgi:hypothetical protein
MPAGSACKRSDTSLQLRQCAPARRTQSYACCNLIAGVPFSSPFCPFAPPPPIQLCLVPWLHATLFRPCLITLTSPFSPWTCKQLIVLPRPNIPTSDPGLHLTSLHLVDILRPRTINRHNGLLYLLRPVLHKGRAPRTSHPNSFVFSWLTLSIVASMLTTNQQTPMSSLSNALHATCHSPEGSWLMHLMTAMHGRC